MILGIFCILLAAVLNVILLLIPVGIIAAGTVWLVDLMQKLHWFGRTGALVAALGLMVFGVLLGACLQLWLWNLAPHAEPERWTLAVAAFAVGQACLLVLQYKALRSPGMRMMVSCKAAVESCGFAFICFLAFTSTPIFGFLAAFPVRLVQFVVGGKA